MSEQGKRYRAFISYSQKDKVHARRLHLALESYRVPRGVEAAGIDLGTRKLGRVFRDDDEMGAATDLGAALKGAIEDTDFLIVICSPDAAESKWVNEEILHFKRTGRHDRIFAIIVSGEPNPIPERRERQCFPPALRFEVGADGALTDRPTEPLGLDSRKEPFGRLIARLASGLVNAPFDTLWRRARRRAQVQAMTISLASVVAALTLAGAVTQNYWRPRLDSHLRYTRFTHGAAELTAASPLATFQDCREASGDCPVMVIMPSGDFVMGSIEFDPEDTRFVEYPQHVVNVAAFAISRTEVSYGEWRRCFDAGACGSAMPDQEWKGEDQPVSNVSILDARRYVSWLSRVSGQQYRLPSEAEWEYAARAQASGDAAQTRFPWGDQDPVCDTRAPNGAAFSRCQNLGSWPVQSFPPNAFGLYDMNGNLWEWVEDCWHTTYEGAPTDGSAWMTGDCTIGTVRGGSFPDEAGVLRSASRYSYGTYMRQLNIGFRVVRTL